MSKLAEILGDNGSSLVRQKGWRAEIFREPHSHSPQRENAISNQDRRQSSAPARARWQTTALPRSVSSVPSGNGERRGISAEKARAASARDQRTFKAKQFLPTRSIQRSSNRTSSTTSSSSATHNDWRATEHFADRDESLCVVTDLSDATQRDGNQASPSTSMVLIIRALYSATAWINPAAPSREAR